jgi:hypothetical protein
MTPPWAELASHEAHEQGSQYNISSTAEKANFAAEAGMAKTRPLLQGGASNVVTTQQRRHRLVRRPGLSLGAIT